MRLSVVPPSVVFYDAGNPESLRPPAGLPQAKFQGETFARLGFALVEILQFLEAGRLPGLLSVEDGVPADVLGFEEGNITSAQTRLHEGLEAVRGILSVAVRRLHGAMAGVASPGSVVIM